MTLAFCPAAAQATSLPRYGIFVYCAGHSIDAMKPDKHY
jgi:hypothetical protein